MSNIEQHVTSRELSERLAKLGVPQKSTFKWYECFLNEDHNGKTKTHWALFVEDIGIDPKPAISNMPDWYDEEDFESGKEYSAFLSSELGEILWNAFEKHGWDLLYTAYGEVFNFKGTQRIGELGIINLMRNPEMGGKMLEYLITHGLITL